MYIIACSMCILVLCCAEHNHLRVPAVHILTIIEYILLCRVHAAVIVCDCCGNEIHINVKSFSILWFYPQMYTECDVLYALEKCEWTIKLNDFS